MSPCPPGGIMTGGKVVMRKTVLGWAMLVVLGGLVAPAVADELTLVEAIKRGDSAAIRALLARRADVNASEPDGTTPLHWAVHSNDPSTVTMIVRAGANVTAAEPLRRDAPDARGRGRQRPDHRDAARRRGRSQYASAEGETVLMTAARTGNADASPTSSREAPPEREGNVARSVRAHVGGRRGPPRRRARARRRRRRPPRPLGERVFAVPVRRPFRRRRFVDEPDRGGRNVNEAAGEGTTALVLATINAHYALAAQLLERGADPERRDAGRNRAPSRHVRTRNYEFGKIHRPAPVQTGELSRPGSLKMLIEHGATVDAQMVKALPRQGSFDNNYLQLVGATSFLLAARAADPTLMRRLLEHGADL